MDYQSYLSQISSSKEYMDYQSYLSHQQSVDELVERYFSLTMKNTSAGSNGINYISALPEPIIHHIMSFLSPQDIKNIPRLSKQFKSLWTRFPILYFHLSNISASQQSQQIQLTDNFLAYVKRSIQLRKLNTVLTKFSIRLNLNLTCGYDYDSRVDEIICFALKNNVQDFDLQICSLNGSTSKYLRLMEGFKSTSLTDLNLLGIHLDIDLLISSCPSLKSLTVTKCSVSGTESLRNTSYGSLRKLSFTDCVKISYKLIEECVAKSVNLESLKVNCLGNSTGFRVANQKLETIEFSGTPIEIVAPNLRSLYLGSNTYVSDKWLKALVSSLRNLENLKLEWYWKMERAEIFNDSIRSLELLNCDKVVEVAVDAKKLTSFTYSGRVAVFTLMNSSRLFNATLRLYQRLRIYETGEVDEVHEWNTLRELLFFFNHCDTLTLVCFSSKDFIVPEDIRARRLPPLYGVKNLRITYPKDQDIKINPEVVDNFLWLSPHLESLSFAQDSRKEKIIKLYYDSEKKSKGGDFCCRGLPFSCWRDDFKDIELKNFDATDDTDQLWKYFNESAILSKNSLQSLPSSLETE